MFRPELRVLAALAVAVVIALWLARPRPPSAPPAGTGPGISVDFAAAVPGSAAAPGHPDSAVLGLDAATPSALPAAVSSLPVTVVKKAFGALRVGTPVLEIPDSDTASAAENAVRHVGGQPRLVMITAISGERAASYAERFGLLYPAVKGAAPGDAVGGYIGEYDGTFLRTFLRDGGSRAAFVDFGFYGEKNGQAESERRLLGELATVSGQIGAARSVIAGAAPARAGRIALYVGPWNITSAPSRLRFTSFAALWDAELLGRILLAGAGSLADGAGLVYDGDGTAPRAYQAGSPTPQYAAIAMFTGAGAFPGFGTRPASAVSALGGVHVFASASPDEVVVVNTSGSARTTVLHVSGDSPLRAAQWRLGEDNGAVSGPSAAGTATSRNGSFALSLPPGSVTTVAVTAGETPGGSPGPGAAGSAAVTVRNTSTGQCLASDTSGTVATGPCDGSAAQEWRLAGTTLVNRGTGRCLAGDAAGRVTAAPCDGGIGQDWYNLGSLLVSARTGRCLDGNGTGEVYTPACGGASQQKWALAP